MSDDKLRTSIRAIAAARERACEAAIQSGRWGVRETHHPDGTITVEATAAVPFGQFHVHTEMGR